MRNKFTNWFANFMQGRYGVDDLGRFLITCTIVVFIVGIVLNLLSGFLGTWAGWVSMVISWLAMGCIVFLYFRMFSRNIAKRRAENDRFLVRKRNFTKRREQFATRKDYKYLKCGSCGQRMRVPRGKGKVSVKCPKCGEKTVVKS